MRHYEIVFLVHPDQSDQTQLVLNKFSSLVTDSGGKVHRSENIGRRKLAYPIQDQFKASYALINIECNAEVIEEIKSSFKFNDSIIRDLILVKSKAGTSLSALSAQTQEEDVDYVKDHKEISKAESSEVKTDSEENSSQEKNSEGTTHSEEK
tara:strand:- start:1503 stop:1958 length:456 start_codon:yes stop_codon:yes gene_type:complete